MNFTGKLIYSTIVMIVIGIIASAIFKAEQYPIRHTEKITDLDSPAIHTILLHNNDTQVELKKLNNRWHVNFEDRNIPANQRLVSELISLSQQNVLSNFDNTEQSKEQYGLLSSKLSLTYNDTTIIFGKSEPFADRFYIYVNDKIKVVDDHIFQKLQLPATDFIDRSLIQSEQKVTNLRTLWQQRPLIPLPTTITETLLGNWQNARADYIEKYQGQEAIGVVVVQTNFEHILQFGILSSKNTLKLARKDLDIVYVVPKQYTNDLLTYTPHQTNTK